MIIVGRYHPPFSVRQVAELVLCAGQLAHVPEDNLRADVMSGDLGHFRRGKPVVEKCTDLGFVLNRLQIRYGNLCPVCLLPMTWEEHQAARQDRCCVDPLPTFVAEYGREPVQTAHPECTSLSGIVDQLVSGYCKKLTGRKLASFADGMGPLPKYRMNPRRPFSGSVWGFLEQWGWGDSWEGRIEE